MCWVHVHGGTSGKVEDMEIQDKDDGFGSEHGEKQRLWTFLKKFGKDPCGVCQKGVGSYAICVGCLCRIHKKCNSIKGPLRLNPGFR